MHATLHPPMSLIDTMIDALKTNMRNEIKQRDDTIAMLQQAIESQHKHADRLLRDACDALDRTEKAEERAKEAERRCRSLEAEAQELKKQISELQRKLESGTQAVTNINFMAGSQGSVTEIHDNQNVTA